MTIRRQILLFVLPLFVVIGGISSAFSCWLELTVARGSYIDGSEAIAISTAEWITPADLSALRAGTPLAQTRLGPITDRLLRWGHVRRFTLLDPDTAVPLADTTNNASSVATAADLKRLTPGAVLALPIRSSTDGSSQHEPYLTFVGPRLAVLAVEVSADDYLATRHRIVRAALLQALLVTIIGAVLAYMLGTRLRRQVGLLRQSVSVIGKPAFETFPLAGGVHEVADLASTFAIIHKVHVEIADRTQRSLSEADFHRDERSLAEIYNRAVPQRGTWTSGRVSAAWLSVGTPLPSMMAGVVPLGGEAGVAFVGIAGLPGDLAAALRADAAARFLSTRLAAQPVASAARETVSLFGLTQLSLLIWNASGLSRWSSETDTGSALQTWTDGPVVLSALGPLNTERLDLFLANFPARPSAALLEDFPLMADTQEPGAVLVLRRTR
jgi:hypothetical protein